MTYQEFIFLASLNTWPDDGLPLWHIVDFAVYSTEGDSRGNVTHAEMKHELEVAQVNGWAESLKV
jgi:hypothetical protein